MPECADWLVKAPQVPGHWEFIGGSPALNKDKLRGWEARQRVCQHFNSRNCKRGLVHGKGCDLQQAGLRQFASYTAMSDMVKNCVGGNRFSCCPAPIKVNHRLGKDGDAPQLFRHNSDLFSLNKGYLARAAGLGASALRSGVPSGATGSGSMMV